MQKKKNKKKSTQNEWKKVKKSEKINKTEI